MRDSGNPTDEFDELTQKCLGEQIIDGREITAAELDTHIEQLKGDKDELCNHWLGTQLIRKIDYGR
jgi:hypothetical protein